MVFFFFFFNDTATTEIYTLSLHDALPIFRTPGLPEGLRRAGNGELGAFVRTVAVLRAAEDQQRPAGAQAQHARAIEVIENADRKSTRLNSSHDQISYAVFCLKKKKYTPYH